jgi:hypothetical protein
MIRQDQYSLRAEGSSALHSTALAAAAAGAAHASAKITARKDRIMRG